MTRLYVRSALSILQDGSIDLGEQDVRKLTVGDVKHMIATHCCGDEIPIEEMLDQQHRLFWQGYLLDEDGLPVSEACVGVDPGEVVQGDEPELVLFLTEKDESGGDADDAAAAAATDLDSSFQSLGRLRSNSINEMKDEIRKAQATISNKCAVM
eukprot:CAMPEP_0197721730 /NCGR_PEP_ID=MMETSP1434-20131217/4687_1 /TAXON_ID=265543 /ORGANISM="Minutocellus polymorphus, Strain CCMP3303" /LENGTH=153 /DNA_ID=CAMNT_0043306789 /DNA_START=165 /DNA_END=626 /DNA_ORIENTATION=+